MTESTNISPSLPTVAFLGLGVMGFPMAGHLASAGFPVTVYNRTGKTADDWLVQYQNGDCAVARTPSLAVRDADIVAMCVGNDDDVRSVVFGDHGALAAMKAGSLLIDHTTASEGLAKELAAACHEKEVGCLDAPVSGGQAGAENGALTIMVGGPLEAFARGELLFQVYGKKHALMGAHGAGQLTKMVNQICIAGVLQGLSEGIHFAQRAGLDVMAVVDVIAQGAAQSWQMENRAASMNDDQFEFGFAVDWMRKDLGMALDAGRARDAKMPLTALIDQFYGDVQALGGGRWDTSSLLRRLTPPES